MNDIVINLDDSATQAAYEEFRQAARAAEAAAKTYKAAQERYCAAIQKMSELALRPAPDTPTT